MSRSNSNRRPAERRPIEDDFSERMGSLAAIISSEIAPRLSLLHATLSTPDGDIAPNFNAEELRRFARLVLDPDASVARRHVTHLREHGLSTEHILVELFEPVARRLGEMWDDDECDLMDVANGMGRLHFLLATMDCDFDARVVAFKERSILMSTMPGSQHSFGIAVVEKLLTAWGWQVRSERPRSMDQILDAVRDHPIAVVGLSVSRTDELGSLARAVSRIRRFSKNSAIGVMVGGPALCAKPEMAATVGADATAANGLLAILAAQKLFDGRFKNAMVINDESHTGANSVPASGPRLLGPPATRLGRPIRFQPRKCPGAS